MSRELLERALIALKTCDQYKYAGETYQQFSEDTVEDSIKEIEAALAEPEQEPVAWLFEHQKGTYVSSFKGRGDGKPLYTHPPRQEPVYLSEQVAVTKPKLSCYECNTECSYLFSDGRCKSCTRLTPEEVTGVTL